MVLDAAGRRARGEAGERLAAGWLERAGCRLLTRNYRCRGGEVDLIVEDQGELVFVEVRTRQVGGLVGPEESVTWRKQGRLLHAAEHYLQATDSAERPWRVDLVAIEVEASGRVTRVEHIKGILS